MELTKEIRTSEARRAAALRFSGDLAKVDYKGAYARIVGEMARRGIAFDKSDYFDVYPSDPSVYAGTCADPTQECLVDVCLTLPDGADFEPQGDFRLTTIPAGRWIVYTMRGPYELISAAYCEMYSKLLPEAYKECRPDPSRPMMERYINDPGRVRPEDFLTEFWHPIF